MTCMLMFIPTYGILLLIRLFAVITKYMFWMNNGVRLKRENHNVKTLVASLVGLRCTVQCPCTRAEPEAERLGEIIS